MNGHINLCGISGGKDSAALLIWALMESGYPKESLAFTFTDTGNEHEWTYEQIEVLQDFSCKHGGPLIQRIVPPLDFWDLAFKKHRFPSAKARFCTEHLKIIPMLQWCALRFNFGFTILAHSGIRAGESLARSELEEWDLNGVLLVRERRPLIKWSLRDVFDIHKRYGVPLNKLYAAGARRVGCFPCIMSRKAEVRNVALNFPERIQKILEEEARFPMAYGRPSSFFASKTVPTRFRKTTFTDKNGKVFQVATIHNVVDWALSGDKARGRWNDQGELFDTGPVCQSGFCE